MMGDETPRGTGSAPKEVPDIIEFLGSPSYIESMLVEARSRNERFNDGFHSTNDPLCSFLNGVEWSVLHDFSRVGDLDSPSKDSSSKVGGPSSSRK